MAPARNGRHFEAPLRSAGLRSPAHGARDDATITASGALIINTSRQAWTLDQPPPESDRRPPRCHQPDQRRSPWAGHGVRRHASRMGQRAGVSSGAADPRGKKAPSADQISLFGATLHNTDAARTRHADRVNDSA